MQWGDGRRVGGGRRQPCNPDFKFKTSLTFEAIKKCGVLTGLTCCASVRTISGRRNFKLYYILSGVTWWHWHWVHNASDPFGLSYHASNTDGLQRLVIGWLLSPGVSWCLDVDFAANREEEKEKSSGIADY